MLFDDIKTEYREDEQTHSTIERLRKDKLSAFWQSLVADATSKKVALAKSCEEKAIGLLSGFKVADACAQLVQGRDYHLATLVARIGNKGSSRRDMQMQLADWRRTHVLSEFSQPIRAIYELLAGNVCVCEGERGPVEDRIGSFVISDHFEIDWRRAFGLRLWYGTLKQESIESAVAQYAQDVAAGKETARPVAWYTEQGIPPLWTDAARTQREDLLWVLLKLFAYPDTDLYSLFSPENFALSPVDFRMSWQLGQILTSVKGFRSSDEGVSDRLTLSFAAQITSEGSWLDAVFVLLHLQSEDARAKSVQDHLSYHAKYIGAEQSETFQTLVNTYMIPEHWVWEAKALYARSVEKNSCDEVDYLIKAGSYTEAHRTFAREVAPKAVIEMDYDTLRRLLADLGSVKGSVAEWHLGGEVYQDYLQLLDSQKRAGSLDHAVLDRLLAGLSAIVQDSRNPSFMETVAAEIIGGVVAKTVVSLCKNGGVGFSYTVLRVHTLTGLQRPSASKVLRLPLTEDVYLKHTVELSLEYYRALMSGGK